jgi:ABC-type sugar transport system ATPase subunit
MLKRNQTLRSPAEFEEAMKTSVKVMVMQKGKLLDFGGPIERYTEDAVYIDGGYYLTMNCEFRVR